MSVRAVDQWTGRMLLWAVLGARIDVLVQQRSGCSAPSATSVIWKLQKLLIVLPHMTSRRLFSWVIRPVSWWYSCSVLSFSSSPFCLWWFIYTQPWLLWSVPNDNDCRVIRVIFRLLCFGRCERTEPILTVYNNIGRFTFYSPALNVKMIIWRQWTLSQSCKVTRQLWKQQHALSSSLSSRCFHQSSSSLSPLQRKMSVNCFCAGTKRQTVITPYVDLWETRLTHDVALRQNYGITTKADQDALIFVIIITIPVASLFHFTAAILDTMEEKVQKLVVIIECVGRIWNEC